MNIECELSIDSRVYSTLEMLSLIQEKPIETIIGIAVEKAVGNLPKKERDMVIQYMLYKDEKNKALLELFHTQFALRYIIYLKQYYNYNGIM